MITDDKNKILDLHACCSSLGFREDNVYKPDVDVEASLRMILRYLRLDGMDFAVRLELFRLKIVHSDLVPLLNCIKDSSVIYELVIRLLLNLTQPALVCFRNEIPEDRDCFSVYTTIDDSLKSLKFSLVDVKFLSKLSAKVSSVFDKEYESRTEDERLLIEKILVLLRNILHIGPSSDDMKCTEQDFSAHDKLIQGINKSNWIPILLFLTNGTDECSTYVFHVLEIISLILKEQEPDFISNLLNAEKIEKEIFMKNLIKAKEKEKVDLSQISYRSNRFGSTYEFVVKANKNPIIYHSDISKSISTNSNGVNLGKLNLDRNKKITMVPGMKKPLMEETRVRISPLEIRKICFEFCSKFLQFCYNVVMKSVRQLLSGRKKEAFDETYYLWTACFFMKFARLQTEFRSNLISETINITMMKFIYDQLMFYRDELINNKRGSAKNKLALANSRRIDLTFRTLNEYFMCLQKMVDVPKDVEMPAEKMDKLKVEKEYAETCLINILYVSEYLDIYPLFLKEFEENIHSRDLLKLLIDGSYLFYQLIKYCQESCAFGGKISTRKKIRRIKRKKNSKKANEKKKQKKNEDPGKRYERLSKVWREKLKAPIIEKIKSLEQDSEAQERISEIVKLGLFDPASELKNEEQAKKALVRLQKSLHEENSDEAFLVAQGIWETWPEYLEELPESQNEVEKEEVDAFTEEAKTSGLNPDQIRRYIMLAQLNVAEIDPEHAANATGDEAGDEIDGNVVEEEDDYYQEEIIAEELEDSDLEESRIKSKDSYTDANSYISRFSNNFVIKTISILFGEYIRNSVNTNKAILHIFHNIAVKCKMPGCFFQMRLFNYFQEILYDKVFMRTSKQYEDFHRFIIYILRKFFVAFEKNRSLLIESCFLRSIKENFELVDGYGTYDYQSKSTNVWKSEEEKALVETFNNYRNEIVPRGRDLVDVVLEHFPYENKTRRMVISKLIQLDLVKSLKEIKLLTKRPEKPIKLPKKSAKKRREEDEKFIDDADQSGSSDDDNGHQFEDYEEKMSESNDEKSDPEKSLIIKRRKKAKKNKEEQKSSHNDENIVSGKFKSQEFVQEADSSEHEDSKDESDVEDYAQKKWNEMMEKERQAVGSSKKRLLEDSSSSQSD